MNLLSNNLFFQDTNLTYGELEDFARLVFGSGDNVNYKVFLNMICPELECDFRLSKDNIQKLLKVIFFLYFK